MIDKIGATPAVGFSSLSGASGASAAGGAASAATGDFASMLSGFLNGTIDTVRAGEKAAVDGLSGKMPLQEVVDKVVSAEQSLQAAIAVRDKIVAAYLEISRMNI